MRRVFTTGRRVLCALTCFSVASLFSQTPTPSASAVYLLPHGFTSVYFGFSYSVPDDLVPNTTEVEQRLMKQGVFLSTGSSLVLFAAFEKAAPGSPRRGVTVMAHNVLSHGGASTGEAYLENLAPGLKRQGWVIVGAPKKSDIAGHEFFQSNYSRNGAYQSLVCTVSKGYILDFALTGKNEKDIAALYESLSTLKFGLKKSD